MIDLPVMVLKDNYIIIFDFKKILKEVFSIISGMGQKGTLKTSHKIRVLEAI